MNRGDATEAAGVSTIHAGRRWRPASKGVLGMPWLRFAFGSAILMGLAIVAAVRLGTFEIRRLNERVRELETEKRSLSNTRTA
jgi:hypothetical protein